MTFDLDQVNTFFNLNEDYKEYVDLFDQYIKNESLPNFKTYLDYVARRYDFYAAENDAQYMMIDYYNVIASDLFVKVCACSMAEEIAKGNNIITDNYNYFYEYVSHESYPGCLYDHIRKGFSLTKKDNKNFYYYVIIEKAYDWSDRNKIKKISDEFKKGFNSVTLAVTIKSLNTKPGDFSISERRKNIDCTVTAGNLDYNLLLELLEQLS